jgi:UV DNA damage endonuclease
MPSRLPITLARLLALLPRPSYRKAASTMTPKRKRTGAHPPPPIPEMPDTFPRRSSRRIKEATDERTPKIDVTKMASDPMKLTNTKKANAVWDTGEGVEEAIRELSEMEHKLQDAVRAQRLAVESSHLHVKKEIAQEPGIRPKV